MTAVVREINIFVQKHQKESASDKLTMNWQWMDVEQLQHTVNNIHPIVPV